MIVCKRCNGTKVVSARLTEKKGVFVVKTSWILVECLCAQYSPEPIPQESWKQKLP